MKNLIGILIILAVSTVGCNNLNRQLETKDATIDSLKEVNNKSQYTLNEFVGLLNEIEENLQEIKERENLIELNSEDLASQDDQKILNDLQQINTLMAANHDKLYELKEKLHQSDKKQNELQRLVRNLRARIVESDSAVQMLAQRLETAKFQKTELESTIVDLNHELQTSTYRFKEELRHLDDQLIARKMALNTGYLAIGDLKSLLEENIVEKEGGILGIGSVKKVNENIDEDHFTKLDIVSTDQIFLNVKKAEMISDHPSDSYELKKEGEFISMLKINKPDKFWEKSKYLVVAVN
ncbi:MAG: hypothetical protein RJQ09_00895 [Cyclobacteriaceae bacterium]